MTMWMTEKAFLQVKHHQQSPARFLPGNGTWIAWASKMHCQVLTCPLQRTPSVPNEWPCAQEGFLGFERRSSLYLIRCLLQSSWRSTPDLRQLSLQSLPPLPSSGCHPCCKLLGRHKGRETGNKAYIQSSADIRSTHKEVKAILVRNFWAI